ncbi:unnamed protein product [Nippostrongylus brasiliensis]|uniref:Uncharacterized protein n=1 Tax=Nippostrongylus brasiliensis TaxID=27835 RepID=A0A0N4XQC3_NIPBR|nr:unnamed protein product [Nippostrongylus brasiliensis]
MSQLSDGTAAMQIASPLGRQPMQVATSHSESYFSVGSSSPPNFGTPHTWREPNMQQPFPDLMMDDMSTLQVNINLHRSGTCGAIRNIPVFDFKIPYQRYLCRAPTRSYSTAVWFGRVHSSMHRLSNSFDYVAGYNYNTYGPSASL